ncbi:MAG: hypothetical protein WED00_11405 [Aquisalimonadaceae bacterium]
MKRVSLFMLLLLGVNAPPALAVQSFSALASIPDQELAALRGGFVLPNGVELSLGLESGVLINGERVAHAMWLNGDMARSQLGMEQAGLSVRPLESQHGLGWVVQNQLDNQVIQHISELHLNLEGVRGLAGADLGRMTEAQSVFQVLR